MGTKRFAIPLNSQSVQTGDVTFDTLVGNQQAVTFRLSNATAGNADELDLITTKAGSQLHHKFAATVSGGNASVNLTANQVKGVFDDADGADWDYVEAHWTVGAADTPTPSSHFSIQSGSPYDTNGWPPKPKH